MWKLTPKEQKLLLLLAFLLVVGAVLRFALPENKYTGTAQRASNAPLSIVAGNSPGFTAVAAEKNEKQIVVHVVGAVARPGVYHLPEGSRVYQALELAGGGLAEADLERLNLAQLLVDGQQVFLPLKGEEGTAGTGLASTGRININTATREQLESLPGIGAVKAQNIINYRQQNGPFQNIEDLLEVSGIGTKTLEGIRDLISVW